MAGKFQTWSKRMACGGAGEKQEPKPVVLEGLEHVTEKLTTGTPSKKVMAQLHRSNRAYKSWATRRNKENDNGT